MKYCSECAAALDFRIPAGESLPRHVCPSCGAIHYLNPKLIVGCVAQWQGRILLCRRAIEPRLGLWTLPAGFMENGETTKEAALRETFEEACARVKIDALFALISVPSISQVNVFYRASLLDTGFAAGAESLETRLFAEADIPWDALAFRSITRCLEFYFADRRAGAFSVHEAALDPAPR